MVLLWNSENPSSKTINNQHIKIQLVVFTSVFKVNVSLSYDYESLTHFIIIK